ncbi:leucine-rich repeat-containing protein kinase family protein [Pseudomonas sp. Pseusp122]|uniref:leucine-rich repeat-containing protein kinase family protein n=1 Tax=unclassified Pseudomonas TaxID=196821 RepID=UPI0039A74BEE
MHSLEDLNTGKLHGIRRLDLSCGLTEFPRAIFELADSLEVLNLSGNALSSLPDDLYRLRHLRILFVSDNAFTELPPCIGRCEQLQVIGFKANRIRHVCGEALPPLLRSLILTDNQIDCLPEALGDCTHLQKLMMAGNRLQHLPESLVRCQRLELLRIAVNQLTELPAWLLQMPALAWLAHGGNPLSPPVPVVDVPQIPWQQLQLGEKLGEGASGVIQRALWQRPEQDPLAVAVKVYKGHVTSDGSPLDEMAACLVAGIHEQLIRVEGRINDHPEGRAGLVLDLIDPAFTNLAGPPSLESCTRDIYPADLRLEPQVALRIATGIASATAHLHSHGMIHGDLYAHNVLWSPQGDGLLGDFGAAAFHPRTEQAAMLERIETRAFGILLGELLEHCELPPGDPVRALQERCVQPDVMRRPAMIEVKQVLAASLELQA